MSARRRRQRRQDERARRASSSLARFIRRYCSSCGGPRIEWIDPAAAADVFGPEWVAEVQAWMGPGQHPLTEVWHCLDCGDAGAFGTAHDDWIDALDARMTGATGIRPPV